MTETARAASTAGSSLPKSRRLLPVATAAAVVLLLFGVFLTLRTSSGSARTGSAGSPPVLRLVGADTSVAGADGAPRVGAPVRGGLGAGSFVLAGSLPVGRPADAPVYRFGEGRAPTELVRRLATALGVPGTPRREDGGWAVSASPRELRVEDGAGWPWQLPGAVFATSVPVQCFRAPCPTSGDTVAEPTDQVHGQMPPERAKRIASGILRAVDLASDDLTVSQGGRIADVRAARRVDGKIVAGLETNLAMTGTGRVEYGNGWLGTLHGAANFPLVTATDAFRRLAAQPRAYPDICRIQPKGGCAAPEPVKVTGARLGLMLSADEHGSLVVPAWLFTVAGELSPMPVVAVSDRYLGKPSTPRLKPSTGVGSAGGVGGVGPAATPPAQDMPLRGPVGSSSSAG